MTITQDRPVDVIDQPADTALDDVSTAPTDQPTDEATETATAAAADEATVQLSDEPTDEGTAAEDQETSAADAADEDPAPAEDPAAPDAEAADTEDRPGELAYADARHLVIAKNAARKDDAEEFQLDAAFLADILARGVQDPITVRRDGAGRLVVRKGRSRTLGARKAGEKNEERYRVPVFIQPGALGMGEDDDKPAQVDRIVDQYAENKHRHAMTDDDEQGVVQQLFDLDLSTAAIGRALHMPRKELKTRITVARNPRAAAVLDKYEGVTLPQAAVLAEFAEDDETFKSLTVVAIKEPHRFDRVVQAERNRREDAALIEERITELTKAGGTSVVTDAAAVTPLRGLRATPSTPSGTAMTEEDHVKCPGHALLVDVDRPMFGTTPATARTTPVCTDPSGNGHAALHDTSGKQVGKMTEEQKKDRSRVIRNNKLWKAAATARLTWLRQHIFARKTPPKDVHRYIAEILGSGSSSVTRAMEGGNKVACSLLGLAEPTSRYSGKPNPIVEAAQTASPTRATMMTLAVLIGAAEEAMHTNTWRSPNESDKGYFTTLGKWGYQPEVVEQLVNDPKADAEETEGADADADASTEEPGEAQETTDAGDAAETDDEPGEADDVDQPDEPGEAAEPDDADTDGDPADETADSDADPAERAQQFEPSDFV